MSFTEWMATTPQAVTLTWGHLLVIVAITAFFAGARVQLVWSRFAAGYAQFETDLTEVISAHMRRRAARRSEQATKAQFESMTPPTPYAPPAPPVHIASVSKTPTRESGMQQHSHG